MKKIKEMKDKLIDIAKCQLSCPERVDAKELGEVMDMIKDLSEVMYYCTIVESMEEAKDKEDIHYYTKQPYYFMPPWEECDIYNNDRKRNPNQAIVEKDKHYDDREGRSHFNRKMYMEAKELHRDSATQMKELEKYIQELSKDITEMIEGSSPEEKQMLQQKIAMLAQKIK